MDLALLKIDAKKKLPFIKFGDSKKSKVGEWVIAIGNPLGLGGSVTAEYLLLEEIFVQVHMIALFKLTLL